MVKNSRERFQHFVFLQVAANPERTAGRTAKKEGSLGFRKMENQSYYLAQEKASEFWFAATGTCWPPYSVIHGWRGRGKRWAFKGLNPT